MVDESQNTNTQQSGASTATADSLQPIAQTGLQPQTQGNLQTPGGSTLQTTSSQSPSSVNQLDQGSSEIPISGISNTTTNTVTQTTQPSQPHTKQILLYGGVAIIVSAIMAGMVYSLLRQR